MVDMMSLPVFVHLMTCALLSARPLAALMTVKVLSPSLALAIGIDSASRIKKDRNLVNTFIDVGYNGQNYKKSVASPNNFPKKTGNCIFEMQFPKAHSTTIVEVTGLEPATAWSQTRNATNCATPRFHFAAAKVQKKVKSKERRIKFLHQQNNI